MNHSPVRMSVLSLHSATETSAFRIVHYLMLKNVFGMLALPATFHV